MCPDLLAGNKCCNPTCTFAHDENELKKVNICYKTALCSWFLAGTCRNGAECSFAHGDHDLKGNAKIQGVSTQQKSATSPGGDNPQTEPMFVPTAAACAEQSNCQAPVPSQVAPLPNPYAPAQQQYPPVVPCAPPLPAVAPPPPPHGFMPGFVNGMQPWEQPCVGGYPVLPQQEVCPAPFNYAPMAPHAMMPQFADVNINSGAIPFGSQMSTSTEGSPVGAMVPSSPPVGKVPPGLPAPPGLAPPGTADPAREKTFQLTELTIQINMLSEEVRRLQSWIIPQAMQSTASGSPMTSPDSSSGEEVDSGSDHRSFEQKVAGLQNELNRVISEGQRSGKIAMK